MSPFVVDACVMNRFQEERLRGEWAEAQAAVKAITEKSFIALDCEGHCMAEWISCAAGVLPLALQDWVADMLVAGKIRLHEFKCSSMHKELCKLGLPKKDHKWIRLALSVPASFIVTDDIDLFDPGKKTASAKEKQRIKSTGSGSLSRWLKRNHDIIVMCCSSATDMCAEAA